MKKHFLISLTILIVTSGFLPGGSQDIFPVPTISISETIVLTNREPSVFSPNQTFYLLQEFLMFFQLQFLLLSSNHTIEEGESIIGNITHDFENNIQGFQVTHGYDQLIPPNLTFSYHCRINTPFSDDILCYTLKSISLAFDYINDNGTIFVNTPISITIPEYLTDPTEAFSDFISPVFSFYVTLTGLQEIFVVDFPTDTPSASIPILFIVLPITVLMVLRIKSNNKK